jgi:hypothetical protein
MMGKMCKMVMGLMFLVAGACLLAFGLGMLSSMLANVIAGALFLLAGLSFAIHALGMCPMCKCSDEKCCDDKCCK